MKKVYAMCDEGIHRTVVEFIEEGVRKGGLVLEQTYPDPILGTVTERVIIRREDVKDMVKAINSFDSYKK